MSHISSTTDGKAMEKRWRLFVGNLPETVSKEELQGKFELLLNGSSRSTSSEVNVGNVEIRCKNGDNYFGFVNVHSMGNDCASDAPPLLHKVIDLMNNTKWKGNLIKVQLAKESFLDKLKREREEKELKETGITSGSLPEQSPVSKSGYNRDEFRPKTRFPKKPDNFDFEIVSNHVNPAKKNIFNKKNKDSSGESDDEDFHEGIPRFRGLSMMGFGKPETEATNLENSEKPSTISSRPLITNPVPVPVEAVPEEQKDRLARFQRIAGYPVSVGGNQHGQQSLQRQRQLPPTARNFPLRNDTENNHTGTCLTPTPSNLEAPKGVVFKKHKQQNSDILRQQSLDKKVEAKTQQTNLIKASLAQTNISNKFNHYSSDNQVNNGTPSNSKKPKMDLFGDDDEDQDEGESFKLKKQYEGKEGQRLLELRGQWAYDERFSIDDRFKEVEDNSNALPTEEEKLQQMSILNDLLGTNVSLQPKSKGEKKSLNKSENQTHNNVIISRYDPDAEEFQEDSKSQEYKINARKPVAKDLPNALLETEEPIRSKEPATYKTVSNLKSLFSSEDNGNKTEAKGFSLLATFGDDEENFETDPKESYSTIEADTGAPRKFWESNPFKYDSSDEEEDDKPKSKQNQLNKPMAPVGKCEFFFRKNDPRFVGLEDYFLKRDEMDQRIDYDEKRRELRSIVKAKARNAKRKDEKRSLAIRRAIRKKKKYRKTLIKATSVNAVKLGG